MKKEYASGLYINTSILTKKKKIIFSLRKPKWNGEELDLKKPEDHKKTYLITIVVENITIGY